MIYLASPYSHPDGVIRNKRFLEALAYTCEKLKEKEPLFSPIVYGHTFAVQYGIPTDAMFWAPFNNLMLARAAEVRVLKLAGWEESIGVAEELRIATHLNIPITYAEPLA